MLSLRLSLLLFGVATIVGCGGSGASAELGGSTADSDGTTGVASTGTTAVLTSGATPDDDETGVSTSAADTTGGPQVCGVVSEAVLEIGHGSMQFTPLADMPAELLHGPQGGVHITLGIRCPGLDVSEFGDMHLHGEVNGQVVADHPQGVVLKCNERLGVAEGIWLSMVFDVGPELLHEQVIDLDITITDDLGRTASAQAQTLIIDPEYSATGSGSGTGTGSGTGGEAEYRRVIAPYSEVVWAWIAA